MRIGARSSTAVTGLLVWAICGFPLIASMSNFVGMPSTSASIISRTAIAFIALSMTVRALIRRDLPLNILFWLFSIFWFLYLLRMGSDTIFSADLLGRPAFMYWAFAVGTCFLPALAIATHSQYIDIERVWRWLLGASAVTVVLVYVAGDTLVQPKYGYAYDSGRLALDSLNPIAFGHLSASLILVVYWRIRFYKISRFFIIIFSGLLLLGLSGLLTAGSRGPLVALIFSVLFLEIIKGWRGLAIMAFAASASLLLLSIDLAGLDRFLGVTLFGRIESAINVADSASISRLVQLESAWQIFLDSPVLGGALEDPAYQIYPHNIFIEAFMATGFIGGALLIYICLWSLVVALKAGKVSAAYALTGALFVQYFLGAQFSGSLWSVATFWLFLVIFISPTSIALGARKVVSKRRRVNISRHNMPEATPFRG